MIKNLLEETIEFLKYKGKSPENVLWVGDAKMSFSWDEFSAKAKQNTRGSMNRDRGRNI